MLYFVIPVFNERDNLSLLKEEITNVLPEYEKTFVFSDDGSTDGSAQLIEQLFSGFNAVVLGDGKNYGPGHAFDVAFEWVLARPSLSPSDLIVSIEADNTSDKNILPHMVAISNMGYSLVLASVYAQGGGFDQTSFLRKVLSLGANLMLRLGFDISVQTLTSFYRVYHVSLLQKVRSKYAKLITERGFLCMLEILIKCIHTEAKIIEVPMVLDSKRRKGKSKMKLLKTTIDYLNLLFFRRRQFVK